jgi:hypothetical protein
MAWLKRRFAYDEYKPYLEALQKLAGDYPGKDFVMASKRFADAHLSEYYVGLSDAAFAASFHDFEPIPASQLPKGFDKILFGDATKLEETPAASFAVGHQSATG